MNTVARLIPFVIAGLCCVASTGCATALRGGSQKMKIETDPSGATVKVDGEAYTTPAEVVLKRKDSHKVEVGKEGYRTKLLELNAQWDGASLPGLILPGGSMSVAADRATGADLSFSELPKIKLDPAPAGTPPQEIIVYRKKLLTKEEYKQTLADEDLEALRHRE